MQPQPQPQPQLQLQLQLAISRNQAAFWASSFNIQLCSYGTLKLSDM
jgi:hypothetical protein